MSEWNQTTLGAISSKIGSGATPRGGSNAYKEAGISLIRSQNVLDFQFSKNGLAFIDETQAYELKNVTVEKNDVLLNITGDSVARCCLVPNSILPARVNQHVSIVRLNSEQADYLFILYLLQAMKEELLSQSEIGATRRALTKGMIENFEIALPLLPEQKAIASVLSSLDDKIDLLHRQNKTLEAMAETLFRQWFIEEAQEDWEEKPLSNVANFLNGLACQKFPPKNDLEKLPVLKIKELSNGISESSDWVTSEVKPEYIVENGDVIFAWSASLMVKVWDGERCVLNQHLFKVASDDFPKWFYLMWCKHHLDEFISISRSHATTMGHIKRGDLDTAIVLIPSPEEIEAMSKQMNPILDKEIANSKQIKSLEKLRDTLLPKLMSGEVRIQYDKELKT
ncbi:restriction endonuclease subunit S [sulfur-oxidizing endosymbiont of Gigantopelta aegis]|uniref:restriction endonuclease subunit S n=1 Tax=sulfur-oxidizing endosymbiont of Gigantopelta aegis TaxID=2794934 RepID=UPI0018DCEBF8|nr:restriction endonuclease subunit S [sulfur-oxidizing endosymbiont of Gigantopelta aegis]